MTATRPPRRKAGRPPLPEGQARVVLTAQRVRPDTLAWLQQHPKGIGQAIDAAVSAVRLLTAERDGARAERNYYMSQLTPRP